MNFWAFAVVAKNSLQTIIPPSGARHAVRSSGHGFVVSQHAVFEPGLFWKRIATMGGRVGQQLRV